MVADGQPDLVVRTFAHYYSLLRSGETGRIGEADIAPVESLPDAATLTDTVDAGLAALDQAVVIKLNGGLGTSMGMTRAKSLLPVKDGQSFLDIIAQQVLTLRKRHRCRLPLVLMNSFRTRADSLAALERYPELPVDGLGLDFVQHRVPKVFQEDLSPAEWPADADQAWCPPGHGDLYPALVTSGMLGELRERGYRYAFVSNADNLGAALDVAILGYVAANGLPFLMEVADRTEADKKGGHLARRRADGQLVLRESAQCPEQDREAFGDWTRHRYFNTNNLWLDLDALQAALDAREGVLGLPMIRNAKTVVPTDPGSPAVYQLETAMGAAIAVFEGAAAIRVPRTRFAPVKTTNDLLALWSDAYVQLPDGRLVLAPVRQGEPVVVDLDPRFYKMIDGLQARFPSGPPSLIDCARFEVRGDVTFGARHVATGSTRVVADGPRTLRDGETLSVVSSAPAAS